MAYKLLLADDSVTIQRVIELTFADEDVQVIAVGDGRKAIESIQADRPDIVLADVGMPERDGYEVAAFIKGTAELAHIPVLLLTGAFEPIDETRARAVGCDGVLVKPFEPQMVISRVKDLLAGRKPAGLWAASPAAQTPLRQAVPAAPDANVHGAGPSPAAPGGSLEDYFDRLDAAFASLDGPAGSAQVAPPPPAPRPPVEFTPVPHQVPAAHQAPPQHHAGAASGAGGDLLTRGRSGRVGSRYHRRSEETCAARASADRARSVARVRTDQRARSNARGSAPGARVCAPPPRVAPRRVCGAPGARVCGARAAALRRPRIQRRRLLPVPRRRCRRSPKRSRRCCPPNRASGLRRRG